MAAEAGGRGRAWVHLASGIGNIILATPLLAALDELGFSIDLTLDADYPEMAELFRDWSLVHRIIPRPVDRGDFHDYAVVVPSIPPFYWRRFAHLYPPGPKVVPRPPDSLFLRDEQDYYLAFARSVGYPAGAHPSYRLPIAPCQRQEITPATLVLAPGCKTGIMAAKRWPRFHELAALWTDVALVGTPDDLAGLPAFPPHVKSYVGRLTLRESAELMAAAGAVVANDSGLGHLAASIGAPTLLIFGPTPHISLGRFPPHVKVIRSNMPCEPCWTGNRLGACEGRIECLRKIEPATVSKLLEDILYAGFPEPAEGVTILS